MFRLDISQISLELNGFSSVEEAHEDDVYDLIRNTFHDIDDIKLDNLNVKERW